MLDRGRAEDGDGMDGGVDGGVETDLLRNYFGFRVVGTK